MSSPRRIFVIGATGAQGIPVCKGLAQDGGYALRILTRDPSSARAKALQALGDVEVMDGTFASEADLRRGFRGCWGAFVNIDGFNCGEKAEIFWGMRAYELAIAEGIKFFVWGNIDYAHKMSGYDARVRAGHVDGKGRVGDWILDQNKDNAGKRMDAALLTTSAYIEMNFGAQTIMTPRIEDGVVTWRVPIGEGAVPFVALDDCAYYARWLFDHPERASGMNLSVSIAPITYDDLTAAFTKVTGHPARWIDTPLDQYFAAFPLPPGAPAAYNADPKDPATLTFVDNFSGLWNIFKYYGADREGPFARDYRLLDEIFPGRVKSAEEWVRKEDEKLKAEGRGGLWESLQEGNMKMVLKIGEDGRKGRL